MGKKNQSLTALMRCSHYGANLFFARLTWLLLVCNFLRLCAWSGLLKSTRSCPSTTWGSSHHRSSNSLSQRKWRGKRNFGSVIFSLYLNSGTLTKILVRIEYFFFFSLTWVARISTNPTGPEVNDHVSFQWPSYE
jgi:hypothetical protein